VADRLVPTARQRQCFEVYARLGSHELASRELEISLQRQKYNVGEYYRRIGARTGVQAAYLTWGPNDHERDGGRGLLE
jgi:hypothetical protein